MRPIITLLISTILSNTAIAQIVMKGSTLAIDGEALPFINISLYSSSDTTRLIAGGISDLQGNYVLPSIKAGKYQAVISAVGYKTTKEIIRLRMPSAGNIVTHNFTVEEYSHDLDEVVVKGTRKINYVDKSIHTFTAEQIRNARHSSDLLGKVEDLTVDVLTNKITKIGGGSVKILINGVNATDNDLKMIPPDKVLKVEYYNIPPARYATVGTLVNVITKRLDTGWNGGIDVSHAFSTGFGNDAAFIKRVIGNHQLSLDYTLHYRNYKDRILSEEYRYKIDGTDYDYIYDTHEKFGYTTHDINLKYTYSHPGSLSFQAVLSPNFSTNFQQGDSRIFSTIKDTERLEKGSHDNHINTFNPSLNLYFSKRLRNEQELVIDLTGTYYRNKQRQYKHEGNDNGNATIWEDNMDLKNHKQSMIGEIAYTKKQGLGTISAGYKFTLASSRSTIRNVLSNGDEYMYKSGNDRHYVYVEYSNSWKRLLYRIGIGETFVRTHNDDTRFSKWLFSPKVVLAYKINDSHLIQGMLTSSPSTPTISQLSNNATLITRELLRRGNPYLQSTADYIANLMYSYSNPWLNVKVGGIYSYEKGSINTNYREEEINGKKYIVSTSENAKDLKQYGGMYFVSIKPFKSELLTIRFYGIVAEQELNSSFAGRFRHLYTPFSYSVEMRKGSWGAIYGGSIVSRQVDGSYLQQDENVSNLQMFYQIKSLRITAGCYWLFTKSKYYYETLPNDVLRHSCRSYIDDNRSMITIGLSWNFSTGRKLSIDRKIHNADTDKGTF